MFFVSSILSCIFYNLKEESCGSMCSICILFFYIRCSRLDICLSLYMFFLFSFFAYNARSRRFVGGFVKSSICVLFPNACIWRCVCVVECNESGEIHHQLYCVYYPFHHLFWSPTHFYCFQLLLSPTTLYFHSLHLIELKAKTIVGLHHCNEKQLKCVELANC